MTTRRSVSAVAALFLLAGTSVAFGQDANPPADPAPEQKIVPQGEASNSSLVFKEENHDFGRISDDQAVETEFVFQNAGSGTLVILSTKASCGCTVPEMAKKEYAPGETGSIKVTLHPEGKKGDTVQTITITSNDPQHPQTLLKINATVRPMVMVSPGSVNFGEVMEGQKATAQVKLVARLPNFSSSYVSVNKGRFFTGKVLDNASTVVDGEQVIESTIEFSASDKLPRGPFRVNAVVRTSDAKSALVPVEIFGEVVGDLKAEPPRGLYFGVLKPGDKFEKSINVATRSGKSFKITGTSIEMQNAEAAKPNVEIRPRGEGKNDYEVVLGGLAPQAGQTIRGTVTITTDVAADPEIKIIFNGLVRAEGQAPTGKQQLPAGIKPHPASPGQGEKPAPGQPK